MSEGDAAGDEDAMSSVDLTGAVMGEVLSVEEDPKAGERRTFEYVRGPRTAKVNLTNSKGKDYELEIDEGLVRALGKVLDEAPAPAPQPATIDDLMASLPEE